MKKSRILLLAVFIITFLTGCVFKSGDDLLQAPKLPKSYVLLQKQLDAILAKGYAYAAPESGQNRSTVQRVNIDGDGDDEVISFFRESKNGKVTIFLHQKYGEDYVEMGKLEGHGTALESVSYPRFSANGGLGIVLTWKLANDMGKGMSVCAFENGTLKNILDTEYTDFSIADIDGDNIDEIVTLIFEPQGRKYARLFDYVDGHMALVSEASLSQDAKSIARVRNGIISNDTPALFVESKLEGDAGLLTDILVDDNGVFRNIAIDPEQGLENATYRPVSVYASDVNNDNMTEIPNAVPMPGYENKKNAEKVWMLDWYVYSTSNPPKKVCTTYNNAAETWMLTLPDAWRGTVTALKQKDSNGDFYTSFEEYLKTGNVPLLEIYMFTGDDREEMAAQPGMIILKKKENAVYTAKIPQGAGQSALAVTEAQIKEMFSEISREWN